MNRIFFHLPLLILAASLLASCSSVPDNILATMTRDSVRVPEYENMYLRTRMSPPMNAQDKREFLDTYVNYRLKLLEARDQGLDREEQFITEAKQYRNQLANSFLIEHELIDPGTHTLYDRRLTEVKLQHIVVKWERYEDGTIDTMSTRQKAEHILDIVRSSQLPFDTLVMHYSDDDSKERTLGNLGYLIAGTSFPELDDMIYNMKPGEITPHLLRSVFGYHIFKVLDKKPARQRLHPAHILYRLDLNNPNDTAAAYAHLSLVLDSLRRGLATFEDLARRNSQDTTSGPNGGDLGWVTRGTNLAPRFEQAILALKVGEVSGIVRTAFGMHIIKLLDEEPPQPYEQQRDVLRQIYRRERFASDFLYYLERKRREYQFRINDNVVGQVVAHADSTVTTSTPDWEKSLPRKDMDAYLFRTSIGPVSVEEAIRYSKSEPSMQMRPIIPATLDTLALLVADKMIAEKETRDYENLYPEFKRLVQEYRESSMISTLEDREVWSKVSAPEEEVKAWWELHRTEFTFPPRVKFAEIYTYTEKLAQVYLDSINSGAEFQKFAARYTQRPGLHSTNAEWKYLPYDENELSRAAWKMKVGEVSQPIQFQSGFSIIKVLDKQESRVKSYEEAQSAAVAGYKEERAEDMREQWLQRLREKYSEETYYDHLQYAFPLNAAAAAN